MKKSLTVILTFILLATVPAFSQGRFLKNVARDVKSDILGSGGSSKSNNTQPEPSCACSDAQQVIGMSDHKLMYTEINIEMLEDGSFLVQDRMSQQYYIIKDGLKKGPYSETDPQVAAYTGNLEEGTNPLAVKYKDYITFSGGKYTIKFNGKSYGPYGRIDNFILPRSHDKFAATAVENVVATEDDGKKIEEAMEKAKTDQERMELAMQYQAQMQQRIMAGGGPNSIALQLVTNIEGATYQPMMGGIMNGDIKYDDIVYLNMANVIDLKGNKLITVKQEHLGSEKLYVNSANSAYATYQSGTLIISNGKTMSDLFNPYLMKADGKLFLAYMYYSPKKDAIMQCKIPF